MVHETTNAEMADCSGIDTLINPKWPPCCRLLLWRAADEACEDVQPATLLGRATSMWSPANICHADMPVNITVFKCEKLKSPVKGLLRSFDDLEEEVALVPFHIEIGRAHV